MKSIDKFLKFLNTSRNTFATYILTLISIYLAVDRIVEMLLMIFTGVSYSYWGPLQYTLALACPVFAFLFSGKSEFASSNKQKVVMFYVYAIGLYIIAISMFSQWLNMGSWLIILISPNYPEIITEFSDLVSPAFTSISLIVPLATFHPFFKWLYFSVNDSTEHTRSIWDYGGIDLSGKSDKTGPYTCELYLFNDNETGKSITFQETARFQSLFVCGGSGTGKSALIFEPFIARDIEKKWFFKQASKELGFTALKTGIAVLNKPYDNDYLNENFNLSMLTPVSGKEALYKTYLKKLILSDSGSIIYKDLGLTIMSPDYELLSHMMEVCDNFHLPYQIIDPTSQTSLGLNPFIYDDPNKVAITISSTLKTIFHSAREVEESIRENVALQAIENLTILLKEIYPRMNDGALPNLEDLLKMLTNFELIQKMCEILAHDEDLAEKYETQITYFRKNFYGQSSKVEYMEQTIAPIISELDNLLRLSGVKTVLCNRHNNINFDDILEEGKITFVCTRRGDLGQTTHKAFGLFFLLSMQNAVFRRPGSESSRIPHFLYIDEFSDFVCKDIEPIFTMYRKYKVGTTFSVQNLAQLKGSSSSTKDTILANVASKIFMGNASKEDIEWWSIEFGNHREWTYGNSFDTEKGKYDPKYSNIKWAYVDYFKPGKLQALKLKDCAYKIKDSGGKPAAGQGQLNFLSSKYKEEQSEKTYNFAKFSTGSSSSDDEELKKKFNPKHLDFIDERNEFNPIQTDTTDSNFLFDSDDAIIVNLKKGNPNSDQNE